MIEINPEMKIITQKDDLEQKLILTDSEIQYFNNPKKLGLPFKVTEYYLDIIGKTKNNGLRSQAIPTLFENNVKDFELKDPLGEDKHSPIERLIHAYPDRVLILVTDVCAMYCRHCFRRHFAKGIQGQLTESQLENIAAYIKKDTNIREVLLSGGDPLTLDDNSIIRIVKKLRNIRKSLIIRICTRIPVVNPTRITSKLVGKLKQLRPIWVVTQFNLPEEITRISKKALNIFLNSGIPILNQTVLLKGINDDPQILKELFTRLVQMSVKPYYLFQGDLAHGTSHFRVSLKRGLNIVKELEKSLSPLCMPIYSVDLPGGGGKYHLNKGTIIIEKDESYIFTSPQGGTYSYPIED